MIKVLIYIIGRGTVLLYWNKGKIHFVDATCPGLPIMKICNFPQCDIRMNSIHTQNAFRIVGGKCRSPCYEVNLKSNVIKV